MDKIIFRVISAVQHIIIRPPAKELNGMYLNIEIILPRQNSLIFGLLLLRLQQGFGPYPICQKVIGWALSADLETVHTTIPAIETAFANRKAREGLLFHSDRGSQYCAKSFRERLGELCSSVRRSMSRKGDCWDNACAESLFKTLKRELEMVDGKHTAEK
jgi:hypothetical protein